MARSSTNAAAADQVMEERLQSQHDNDGDDAMLEQHSIVPPDEEDEEEEEEEDEDEQLQLDEQHALVDDGFDSASDSATDTLTWISWFCSLPGHEYFAEVAEDFIEDDFNLTGLNALVPFYKEALEMILDVEPQEDSLKIPDVSIVESSAELLYGLIHQRFILTRQGLQQMVEKYDNGHFGYCPRVFCHSHPVLPCGRSDLPGLDTVKLFCANCIDNYAPPSSRFHGVDGAFFGTTFPHLLFQSYRDLAPSPVAPAGSNAGSLNVQSSSSASVAAATASAAASPNSNSTVAPATTTVTPSVICTLKPEQLGTKVPASRLYTPRIYGFRVSEMAKSGPRMRWMRMRPESFAELVDPGVTAAAAQAAQAAKVTATNAAQHGATVGVGGSTSTTGTATATSGTVHAQRSTVQGRPLAGRGPGVGAAL